MSFSQNSEESFILDYFKDKPTGKFIDVGSYDVEKFSNVRALVLKGWGGIMVEPAPKQFKSIFDFYKSNENITVLNVAIGATTGEIDFYECEDAVSTSEYEHMHKWADAGVPFTKIKVPQLSVESFFNLHGEGTNFLSIDTEFTNIIIFREIKDWVWDEIQMVCIEHDNYIEEIESKLTRFGFSRLYVNAENLMMAKI